MPRRIASRHLLNRAGAATPALDLLTCINTAYMQAYGNSVLYTGQTITGSDSIVRAQTFADIESKGKQGYLKRIRYGDPLTTGSGNRAEFTWGPTQTLVHGVDYWWAFAYKPISGEVPVAESGASDQIFFQVHQHTSTGAPTFSIAVSGAGNALFISRVYGGEPGTQEYTMYLGADNSAPTPDVWTRFIVHLRFSPDATYSPAIEVWKNETQILSRTSGTGAYIGQTNDSYYTKCGFYKWNVASTNYGTNQSRAAYYSEVYFQQGTNLYLPAVEAIAAFV